MEDLILTAQEPAFRTNATKVNADKAKINVNSVKELLTNHVIYVRKKIAQTDYLIKAQTNDEYNTLESAQNYHLPTCKKK